LLDDAEQRMRDSGSFDLIADYAEPLPVLVIAELLGMPDDQIANLRPWSQAIVKMYEYDRTPEHASDMNALIAKAVASKAKDD
jgi:cytochrome P450